MTILKELPSFLSDINNCMIADRFRNLLLAALPGHEWDMIAEQYESADLPLGRVIAREREAFHKIYFPIDCVISTLAIFESGASVEMAITGREGMVPVGAILGRKKSTTQQIVQISGTALAVPYEVFQRTQSERKAFRLLSTAYAEA